MAQCFVGTLCHFSKGIVPDKSCVSIHEAEGRGHTYIACGVNSASPQGVVAVSIQVVQDKHAVSITGAVGQFIVFKGPVLVEIHIQEDVFPGGIGGGPAQFHFEINFFRHPSGGGDGGAGGLSIDGD